ncbi:MAG: ankyrin repeat domain-containing protein [Candidatus Dependentiae bacterium]
MKHIFQLFFIAASLFCCITTPSELPIRQQAMINHALIEAAKRGNTIQTNSLLRRKADPNAINTNHNTPLHFASYLGHLNIAQLLVSARANVNYKNKNSKDFSFSLLSNEHGGVTPLMLACSKGNLPMVLYLLEQEADVNAQDDLGQTPLTYAILINKEWPNKKLTLNQQNIVHALLAHGANPYIEDDYGLTPLYYYERIAELVLSSNKWVAHPEALQQDKLYLEMLHYKAY